MVVAGIAVHDVEVVHLLEVMLGCVGRVHARHARIESAAENGGQPGLLKTLAVSPLPTVFEVCHILWLIVCSVKVVHAALQAGIHDCKVLVWQCHVNHDVGLVLLEECHKLGHAVGIHMVGDDIGLAYGPSHGITLALRARSNHYLVENIGILCTLVGYHSANASRSNNQYFAHLVKFR